ncbi:hypothetical protein [[Clostridium] innocuum]|nr:hypothetical protein [[Clostridium] innocuum]
MWTRSVRYPAYALLFEAYGSMRRYPKYEVADISNASSTDCIPVSLHL